jgi:outer membrane protein OmpA-like peptidoglycan-associated protein
MAKDADHSFSHSITDLMTSLFVVFVLLLVAFINRSYAETKQKSQNTKTQIMNELTKVHIQSEDDPHDPLAFLIRVQDDNLEFDVNQSTLKKGGQVFLSKFIPNMAAVLTRNQFIKEVESIVVEGHTDSSGDDEHNLKLSQERSFSVLKFALNDCDLAPFERNFFLDHVSMNGRGERDLMPIASKPGSENKWQSRRVEFKIRVRSFEQRQVVMK